MTRLRFSVVRLRAWGRKLSDRELQQQPPVVGQLVCFTLDDPHLHRPVRVAKLTHTEAGTRPELIPSLYDAQVIALGAMGATITGIERLAARRGVMVEVAQSWWVRFV
jgi:hypothetical protein